MTSPFLKTILTWRNSVLERKDSNKDTRSKKRSRSKSSGSEGAENSDHSSEIASNLKDTNDADKGSPSFRTMRRHAICEENLREYYSFWCVNNNHNYNEESHHDTNDHAHHKHNHQSNHLKGNRPEQRDA